MKRRRSPAEFARWCRRECEIEEVEELNLELLAEKRNVMVFSAPVNSFLGAAMADGDGLGVCIAEDQTQTRYRFTFAHELGHLFIPWHHSALLRGRPFVDTDIAEHRAADDWEREANEFAAELLVPKQLLRPRLQIGAIDIQKAIDVCDVFNVSITMAALRVAKVSRQPTRVLLWEGNRLKWSVSAHDFPYGVPAAGWTIPGDSATADAYEGKGDVVEAIEVDPRTWLVDRSYGGYPPILESSMQLGRTGLLLTVLWSPR